MRVLCFSDVHVDLSFREMRWHDYLNKRFVGVVNYALRRGRRFRRARAKLAAMDRFARAHDVDLVICTGDYTAFGTEPEIATARRLVEPLTRRPLGFVTLPGNHDVYLHDSVRERRFERHFGEFLVSDLPEHVTPSGWPVVRLVSDEVAVISLHGARPHASMWRADGYVDDAQLGSLRRVLSDPRLHGRFVIVALHYALRRADGRPDAPRHGLENADEVLRAVADVPRGCIVHGHIHARFSLSVPGVGATILGAGSATDEGEEGFWVVDVERDGARAVPGWWDGHEYRLDPRATVAI